MPTIKVEGLTKRYKNKKALEDVSFIVPENRFVSIIGPTGAGKTTLLKMIAGLEKPSEGKIYFDGNDYTEKLAEERELAMIFQDAGLFPHTKVKHNISYGLHKLGMKKEEIELAVKDVSELLKINELLERYPASLSAGEKQRVGIARALVRKPKLLLLDEPFANIDARLKLLLQKELQRIQSELKITMIQVTHDQHEAMRLADYIAVIHEGKLYAFDTPMRLYETPPNLFTAEFIGAPSINTFASSIMNHQISLLNTTLRIADSVKDQVVMIGIRPEDIVVHDGGHFSGIVIHVEIESASRLLTVQTEFGEFVVRTNKNINEGERIFMSIRKKRVQLFDVVTGENLSRINTEDTSSEIAFYK